MFFALESEAAVIKNRHEFFFHPKLFLTIIFGGKVPSSKMSSINFLSKRKLCIYKTKKKDAFSSFARLFAFKDFGEHTLLFCFIQPFYFFIFFTKLRTPHVCFTGDNLSMISNFHKNFNAITQCAQGDGITFLQNSIKATFFLYKA